MKSNFVFNSILMIGLHVVTFRYRHLLRQDLRRVGDPRARPVIEQTRPEDDRTATTGSLSTRRAINHRQWQTA